MLSDEQLETWRREGWVAVEGVFDPAEVAAVQEEARLHFPSRADYDAAAEPPAARMGTELPYAGPALNRIAFHPRLLAVAEQLIGTSDLRLSHATLNATYGTPEPSLEVPDMHLDFAGNSLLTPHADNRFLHLPALLYFTDVTLGSAPTYFVSRKDDGGRGTLPPIRPKERASETQGRWSSEPDPELYEHEVPALVPAGSAVFYTHLTWHRASTPTDPTAFRLAGNVAYRATAFDWMDTFCWVTRFFGYENDWGPRCIEALSPRERELLGIPPPGHPYWDDESIAAFVGRYPNVDTAPYRTAGGSVSAAVGLE